MKQDALGVHCVALAGPEHLQASLEHATTTDEVLTSTYLHLRSGIEELFLCDANAEALALRGLLRRDQRAEGDGARIEAEEMPVGDLVFVELASGEGHRFIDDFPGGEALIKLALI
jgi:hypothetical protein